VCATRSTDGESRASTRKGQRNAPSRVTGYDTRRGYPTVVSIDRIKNAIDDELSWTLDRFCVL